jgi:LPXTG-site transpeptidase (sortase) family protein
MGSRFMLATLTLVGLSVLLFMVRRGGPGPVKTVVSAPETIKQSNNQNVGYTGPSRSMARRYLLLAAALFIAAVAALAYAIRPAGDDGALPLAVEATAAAATAQAPEPGATATPQPGATVEVNGVDVARLVVPSLGIDAPIVTLGVDSSGTMQSPDNPTDVAWYSFSARPGERSNVVLAGHLDYVNYGPAVFYRLKEAGAGDEVQLLLVDGSTAHYRVLAVTSYDEATAPVLDIVGPTENEVVTLITCGGSFDPLSREYDKRVVLRAERIDEVAVGN